MTIELREMERLKESSRLRSDSQEAFTTVRSVAIHQDYGTTEQRLERHVMETNRLLAMICDRLEAKENK